MTNEFVATQDRLIGKTSTKEGQKVILERELEDALASAASARRQLQEAELQLNALRKAAENMQKDLLDENSALIDKLDRLETERVAASRTEEDAAVDVAFYAARADIETKIARQLTAFYGQVADKWMAELRDRLLAAQPAPADSAAFEKSIENWPALVRLLTRTLLTETGRAFDPVTQRRLRQACRALEESGLFDKCWYLEQYPDVSERGSDPIEHYLRHGAREGRLPAASFATPPPHMPDLADLVQSPQTLAEVLKGNAVYPHGVLGAARSSAEAVARAAGAKVSVIVPTYNRATTIERALHSVLEQSLVPQEIIVADDESTDRTLALLEKNFADPIAEGQLVILRCKKGGVCKMRNAALEHATGDVIAYLDSDNFWHPDHLLWAVAALQEDGVHSVYTAANIHHLTEHWSRVDSTPYDRRQLLAQNFIDLNCFVHRAELYQQYGGFDTQLTRLVDWEYILRLTRDTAPVRVPVATVEYFLDKSGLANISFVNSLEENAIKIQLLHREEMRAHGVLNEASEKRLDAAAAKMKASFEPTITGVKEQAPAAETTMVPAGKPRPLPYLGGLNLFVVLPLDIDPPETLPVDFVNPRWISLQADGRWIEHRRDGTRTKPRSDLPCGNYWCPDLRQPMPTAHQLATLTAATQLTQIDLAVASLTLDMPPTVGVRCLRNQLVMRDGQVADFLAGRPPSEEVVGKVLRLPQGTEVNLRMLDLPTLLGRTMQFGKDGQTFGFGDAAPAPVAVRQQRSPVRLSADLPRVLVLAQKLAVGGVERNTIEVARQLQDSHECLYLTLEKIHSEQGSLCHQAIDACAQVIDLAEIAHHGIYLQLLKHLNAVYAPDALWVCNGSMWLAANAEEMRATFSRSGIVDQQVYDVDVGWINRYQEPGIQSFDRFIAINRKIHKKFVRDFGMDPDRIDLVYSAINAQRFRDARAAAHDRAAQRAAFGLPQDKTLMAFMGRLVDQKRPLDFLEVARQNAARSDQHFVLVGNGVLAPKIEAWMAEHKPGNVTWLRNVADTTEFWPAIDAYLVTSEYEGLPIALIEAISLGVPVVATDVGDIRYVLEKYEAGRVVERIGDPAGFSEILQGFVPDLGKTAAGLRARGGDIIDFFSAETISGLFAESFAKARARATGGAV